MKMETLTESWSDVDVMAVVKLREARQDVGIKICLHDRKHECRIRNPVIRQQ